MPRKLKFYHKKNGERNKKLKKLQVEEQDIEGCSEESNADGMFAQISVPRQQLQDKDNTKACSQENKTDIFTQISIPTGWNKQTSLNGLMLFYKTSEHIQDGSNSLISLKITLCLQFNPDLSWSLFVHNHLLDAKKCSALKSFLYITTPETITELFTKIDSLSVCTGQTDLNFVEMVLSKKGKIIAPNGKVVAYVDNCITKVDGQIFLNTICTSECELLCTSMKCASCKAYRTNLRAMHSRWSRSLCDRSRIDTSSHTNDRYLTSPQRNAKIDALRNRMHVAEEEVKRLKEKVFKLSEQGDEVDTDLEADLLQIMNENTDSVQQVYAKGTFARLLWDEQLKAATAKGPRQIRWHPMLIKWCLNLKLLSSSAYHALRTSGFLTLPSERTLTDYVHYFASRPGFQNEVHQQLIEEVNLMKLSESKRYVSLIIDEMKIKEGLVYNKHSGKVIGFTDLGDINNELIQLEKGTDSEHPPIATHVLVLMIRGIFFKLEFPYAHFGTEGISADILSPIVWEAIRRLEIDGIKVICITADGDSSNRKFFRMHKSPELTIPYKTKNPYATVDRWIYFIADSPHLIKTVRNCWSHSGVTGTRHMEVAIIVHKNILLPGHHVISVFCSSTHACSSAVCS